MVKVKGYLGSPQVARSKSFKLDISRGINVRALTLDMWIVHVEEKCPAEVKGYSDHKRSKGQNLVNNISRSAG